MGINEEVERLRAAEASRAREQGEKERNEATRQAECDAEIQLLGGKFLRWAREAGIKPSLYQKWEKRLFGNGRMVDTDKGEWTLDARGTVEQGRGERPREVLIVTTDGEVKYWGQGEFSRTPEEVRACIARFIVKSGSHVPWPD